MTRSRSATVLAPLAALGMLLAACGGGDDEAVTTSPAATESSAVDPAAESSGSSDATEPTATDGGPNATVAAGLPAELDGEVGPIEVVGAVLPDLGGVPIDADPALGTQVPVVVGKNFAGETVRVDPATDGPTMVVFLAHWCPHCNAEVPRLNELRDSGRFPADLNIVAVSTAVNPGQPNFPPSQWVVDMDWTYPVIADGVDLESQAFIGAAAYGVDGFPFVALVDADGKVAARWSGEREPDEVLAEINARLGLG